MVTHLRKYTDYVIRNICHRPIGRGKIHDVIIGVTNHGPILQISQNQYLCEIDPFVKLKRIWAYNSLFQLAEVTIPGTFSA